MWRKVKVDWDVWVARSLADDDIVRTRHCPQTNGGQRLALDGTVIRTRLDSKATNISVLAAIGVRRDGQKILLSIRNMGGESTSAWRQFLDDLDARGLKRPDFVIVDGAPGLEAALTALWGAEHGRALAAQHVRPVRHVRPVGAAVERVAPQLARDGRCSPAERPGDRPKRQAIGLQSGKPIPFIGGEMGIV